MYYLNKNSAITKEIKNDIVYYLQLEFSTFKKILLNLLLRIYLLNLQLQNTTQQTQKYRLLLKIKL